MQERCGHCGEECKYQEGPKRALDRFKYGQRRIVGYFNREGGALADGKGS